MNGHITIIDQVVARSIKDEGLRAILITFYNFNFQVVY